MSDTTLNVFLERPCLKIENHVGMFEVGENLFLVFVDVGGNNPHMFQFAFI